jgi:hypothetical protein
MEEEEDMVGLQCGLTTIRHYLILRAWLPANCRYRRALILMQVLARGFAMIWQQYLSGPSNQLEPI